MIRHTLLLIFMMLSSLSTAQAQTTIKYGMVNTDSLLCTLPDYTQAEEQMARLRKQYEAEADYNDRAFRRQYAEFLEGQQTFTPNILQKRQADLQQALQRGMSFRHEADALLQATHIQLLRPVKARLAAAIKAVGLERGYEYIIDTSKGTIPFIHPTVVEDVTPFIKEKLNPKN